MIIDIVDTVGLYLKFSIIACTPTGTTLHSAFEDQFNAKGFKNFLIISPPLNAITHLIHDRHLPLLTQKLVVRYDGTLNRHAVDVERLDIRLRSSARGLDRDDS